jgi:predicted negative regulator of RcsB-dependent stress response
MHIRRKIMSLFTLVVVGVVAVAAYVAYKLWKSKKAVTGAAVVSGVESVVKTAVADVKSDVTKS